MSTLRVLVTFLAAGVVSSCGTSLETQRSPIPSDTADVATKQLNSPCPAPSTADSISLLACSVPSARKLLANVPFADPELRRCVLDPVNSYTYVDEIKSIICSSPQYEISNLSGIENLFNLEAVILHFSDSPAPQISIDLFPLYQLKKLSWVYVGGARVSSLGAFSGMTSIRNLYAYSTSVSDLSPISNLSQLETLFLRYNPRIQSLAPLAGLTNLTSLAIRGTAASDFSAIAQLQKLTFLDAAENLNLTELSAFMGLTHLETLDLSNDINVNCLLLSQLKTTLANTLIIEPASCRP